MIYLCLAALYESWAIPISVMLVIPLGVIGALIEVHRELGPGLLESAYEACFCRELYLRGLAFERQRPVGVA